MSNDRNKMLMLNCALCVNAQIRSQFQLRRICFTLSEAGNSVLMSSVFHGLAGNIGLCPSVLRMYSRLLHHVDILCLLSLSTEIALQAVIVSSEFSGKHSHKIGLSSRQILRMIYQCTIWLHGKIKALDAAQKLTTETPNVCKDGVFSGTIFSPDYCI